MFRMRNRRSDGQLLDTKISSTDHQTPDEILKLLAVNDLLSILAKLPLDEVTEIALLTGKEFKIIYNNMIKINW